MNPAGIDQIRAIAISFREAIERSYLRSELPTFHHFPRGACGECSNFLGRFFRANGIGGWTYICRSRLEGETTIKHHAWLEKDGLIVDITADQFHDAPVKVIVSINSDWHKTFGFEGQSRPDEDYDYGGELQQQLESTYAMIVEEYKTKAS